MNIVLHGLSLFLLAASLTCSQSTPGVMSFNITSNETLFSHENLTDSTKISTTMKTSTSNALTTTPATNTTSLSTENTTTASGTSTNSTASTSVASSLSSSTIDLTTKQSTIASNSTQIRIFNATTRMENRSSSTQTPKSEAMTTVETSYKTTTNTQLLTQSSSGSTAKVVETTKIISTISLTTRYLQNSSTNETGRLAVDSQTLTTTVGGLTRSESLIGFAVVGCFALVIGGYLLVSCGARRYRRWQLNRLLLSIRGDGHLDPEAEVDIDAQGSLQYGDEDSPDDAVFVRDPPSNRLRLDSGSQRNRSQNSALVGRYGGSLNQNMNSAALPGSSLRSATATASFSRARTTLIDRMGLRTSYDESDCDLLIAERGGETDEPNESVSLVATLPHSRTATSNVVRTYDRGVDGDEPILVLDDSANEVNAVSRNESLI